MNRIKKFKAGFLAALLLTAGIGLHCILQMAPPKASTLQISQERRDELRLYAQGRSSVDRPLADSRLFKSTKGFKHHGLFQQKQTQVAGKVEQIRLNITKGNKDLIWSDIVSNKETSELGMKEQLPICMCCDCGPDCPQITPQVKVYKLDKQTSWNFQCLPLHIKPKTNICLYDLEEDVNVSKVIAVFGIWEPHIVSIFQNILHNNPEIGVIDIGSNLGLYSLIAGRMGHKVLAVEPNIETVYRFHKGVISNLLSPENVTVLHNAVSNARGCTKLQNSKRNQGDTRIESEVKIMQRVKYANTGHACAKGQVGVIHLDDLLPYVNFKTAIMKIDIQGLEHKAMSQACKLLRNVKIPYIFMEWMMMRQFYVTKGHKSDDKLLIERMIGYLVAEGYQAHSSGTEARLEADYWFGWPEDILWKHKDAYLM